VFINIVWGPVVDVSADGGRASKWPLISGSKFDERNSLFAAVASGAIPWLLLQVLGGVAVAVGVEGEGVMKDKLRALTRNSESSGIRAAAVGLDQLHMQGLPLRVSLSPIRSDDSSEVPCHFGVFWSVLE
jgi:hypothetical protein